MRTGTRAGAVIAASLAAAATTPAQQLGWQGDGVNHQERFGAALARLADRDGDGIDELLVGVPASAHSLTGGRARVVSGADLSLLVEVDGGGSSWALASDRFGAAVAALPDVDGDAIEELLIGNPERSFVDVRDGSDGHLRSRFAGAAGSAFGSTLVVVGDIDGDGRDDFAAGAPGLPGANGLKGVVLIVSGASGAELARVDSATTVTGMPLGERNEMAAAGDVDLDGIVDLVLLDSMAVGPRAATVVRLVSGRDGHDLLSVAFDHADYGSYFARATAGAGDVDGDGTLDFVVAAYEATPQHGPAVAFVFSGADGSELHRSQLAKGAKQLVVAPAGDVDGDALPDLAVACDGETVAGLPSPGVHLFAGADGSPIGTFVPTTVATSVERALVAFSDADGDGRPDLVVGLPDVVRADGVEAGAIESWSSAIGAAPLAVRLGDGVVDPIKRMTLIDDVDGDGRHDVIDLRSNMPAFDTFWIEVRSGRDGTALAQHPLLPALPTALSATPDLDGDAIGDYAAAMSDRVELRSSVDGALLQTCFLPSGSHGTATALVVAVQPASGALQVAAGYGLSSAGRPGGGELFVFDAASGALLFQKFGNAPNEQFGSSVAAIADVTSDGLSDWACGAPGSDVSGTSAGRVALLSGATGSQVKALFGVVGERLGAALARIGDASGDGRDDLAVGAPGAGSSYEGAVHLYAIGSWSLLATRAGVTAKEGYGARLARLGDVNGDGVADWATAGNYPPRVEACSGTTALLLARFAIDTTYPTLAIDVGGEPTGLTGSASGDAIPDLLFTCDPEGTGGGHAELWALDDVMLQIVPSIAAAGATVEATLRGRPAGYPTALQLVAFGGVPDGQFVLFGAFDGAGEWPLVDTIPPGLSGLTLDLRGWTLGFAGKLSQSPVQTLTFE